MGRTEKGPKVAWFTRLKASLDISENVKTLGSVPTKDLLCFHQLCVKEINQVNMHTGWKGEQYLRRSFCKHHVPYGEGYFSDYETKC